ncbi:hypothetical protein ACHAQD_011358 [Fusarium lateritium]
MKLLNVITLAAIQAATAKPLDSRSSGLYFDVKKGAKNSVTLERDLISLSIEFGNTIDFFGDRKKPNKFSRQLLQNVADRSGSPTILRIGGNTQDRAIYCEDSRDTIHAVENPDPNDPKQSEALYITFNSNFYHVLNENVPKKSPIILGLNYRNGTIEIAKDEILGAFEILDQRNVMAYELGNEVNLFGDHRPKDYDVHDYAKDMKEWIPQLAAAGPKYDPKFQFGSFAGPQLFKPDMTIRNLVSMGVPQSIPQVEYIAVHGYPWDICSPQSAAQVSINKLLNHTETTNLLQKYSGEITASKSIGKKVHMGETGSVACHGKNGVSNTLGAALWELDYALSGSVAGISRFFFHMGKGDFFYSMWEPLPSPLSPKAHINPTYYTMLFIADLVADLKKPRITAIPLTEKETAAHFAIYDGKKLEKLIFLNLERYEKNQTAPRGSQTYDISSVLGDKVRVRRLTGEESAATTGVTWAGQKVNDSGKVVSKLKLEKLNGGSVTIYDSEAVIVEKN